MAEPIPLDELPVWDNRTVQQPDDLSIAAGAVIPVDKPAGWTSFDVVKYVRTRLRAKKVGHAGTLDPMATGLLLLCCGKATRTISQIQDLPKVYIAEITLGASTPSFDLETEVNDEAPFDNVTEKMVESALNKQFLGSYEQIPPVYSAIRKGGKRLYERARKGEDVKPDARRVTVFQLELLDFQLPRVSIRIQCAKGFYVRSLAYDLGKALGTLGVLSALTRTKTGFFSVEEAWDIESFNRWSPYGRYDSA